MLFWMCRQHAVRALGDTFPEKLVANAPGEPCFVCGYYDGRASVHRVDLRPAPEPLPVTPEDVDALVDAISSRHMGRRYCQAKAEAAGLHWYVCGHLYVEVPPHARTADGKWPCTAERAERPASRDDRALWKRFSATAQLDSLSWIGAWPKVGWTIERDRSRAEEAR